MAWSLIAVLVKGRGSPRRTTHGRNYKEQHPTEHKRFQLNAKLS